MLKIYGRRTSSNVQKVMWLVGELDLPHQRIDLGGKYGGLDTPQFKAMNPNGLIPVVDDGGTIIWESNTIVRHLAARHAMGTWHPSDPARLAIANQWMDWMLTTLIPGFSGVFVGMYRTREANRNWPAIRTALATWHKEMTLLDGILATQPNVTGDRLTMGDIAVATSFYRYHTLDIERPKLPNIARWYAELCERPAYREHVMVPYDELKETF